jgi:transposase
MTKVKSWEVSEAFWVKVEPLIPQKKRSANKNYTRKLGGGRKPMDSRKVFCAIVYVLRTGIQWKALPKEFGSSSSIHKYFQDWAKAGLFKRLWRKGLAEYDDLEGIAWEWVSVDGANLKAPMAKEAVGKNPTDRGKKWKQKTSGCRRAWRPVVSRRDRGQQARCDET